MTKTIEEHVADLEAFRVRQKEKERSRKNGQQDHEAPDAGSAVIVWMDTVERKTLQWLWHGRIPRGKLTLLAGDPGLGKSFVTLDLASRGSTGTPFPGQEARCAPFVTLLMALEDDLEDTVAQRLDALQADSRRICVLKGIKEADAERLPRLDRDLSTLEDAIRATEAGLVVVDPINAYLGKTEGDKDIALRSVLTPLAVLASRTGVAVLAVTHANKGKDTKALHRIMGSLAYVAAARSVLGVGSDPEAPGRQLVVQIKSNLAPLAPGLGFRIADNSLSWDSEPVAVGPEAIFGVPAGGGQGQDEGSVADAVEFLRIVLGEGRQPYAGAILPQAKDVGIAERTLRRAKEALGVVVVKDGYGAAGKWYWTLPDLGEEGLL